MNITLQPVTKDNWRDVYRLSRTLTEQQQHFVAPNAYSMLEAIYGQHDFKPWAVYADATVVGFLMTAYAEDDQQHWISRLMIGHDFQGKGYGRAVMQLAIEQFKAIPDCTGVYISFAPENEVARTLYSSLGFLDTGLLDDGEIVYRLPLKPSETSA